MRIAIPLAGGKLSAHFGHCEEFALIDADRDNKSVESVRTVTAPTHEPGALPRWLAQQGATLIISGGMGRRAQDIFAQQGIEVLVGAPTADPKTVVEQYLAGRLQTGGNVCDH